MRPPALPILSPHGAAATAIGGGRGFPAPLVEQIHRGDLAEESAFLAWQLAALPAGLARAERDDLAVVIGRLVGAQAAGSTRVEVAAADRAWLARAPDLFGDGAAGTPLVLDGDWLYTRGAFACECRVAAGLGARLGQEAFPRARLEAAVAAAARTGGPVPSREQEAAVVAALGHRLGVISGGPGTGKTTTALLVVRSLARLGVPAAAIALAAPTGKAKSRLEDELRARLGSLADAPGGGDALDRELLVRCPEAQTLHHLLGASGGHRGFRRGRRDPLPFAAVIVDESSMIDLVLMDALLDALPAGCNLVLLGDADQLPAVAAGAVFRDLGHHATRLGRGFRADPATPAGGRLVALAASVQSGDAEAATRLLAPRARVDDLDGEGVEHLPATARDELLRRHHDRLFDPDHRARIGQRTFDLDGDLFAPAAADALEAAIDHLCRTRVLCVTRQGSAGVEPCNAFLHGLRGHGDALAPGEPVLLARNDYDRELWNGDQGVVVRARRPGQPAGTVCAFRTRRGWLAVDPAAGGAALGLGYALTVHKAQGSEADGVVLLLPDHASPLLTRELIYTAISRARRGVVVCGDLALFAAGVAGQAARASGLRARLDATLAAMLAAT
jgi:exodeoxyribonuclease V alpha subunit